MIFGFPLALWFTLVLFPVAAAFFYRRHARHQVVPTVDLWASLGTPVASSSYSSLLRRLLSLLMQILLVMVLILALAEPLPRAPRAARTILVLDVSATLQTREEMENRMSEARREALRIIQTLPPYGEVIVLRAGQSPILAQSATRDRILARASIEATESLDVEGDLERAIEAARSFLDPAIRCEVVVISDFAGTDPEALKKVWHDAASLTLLPVGHETPDAAITGFWTEQRGAERCIQVTISQKAMDGRVVPVELKVDGVLVETKPVRLSAKPVQIQFSQILRGGSQFEIHVVSGDALDVDDHAMGIVPRGETHSICLVTSGNRPLERALSADSSVSLRVVSPLEYHGPQRDTVVIMDGLVPAMPQTGQASYLFIGAGDPFGFCRGIDIVDAPPVTHWASDHPALNDIDPTLFRVSKAMKVQWNPSIQHRELLYADTLPLAAEVIKPDANGIANGAVGDARYVYWLFDLKDTDLSRRISFPLLLWNTIDYLADGGRELMPDAQLTGRSLKIPSHPQQAPVVTDPIGQVLKPMANGDGWFVSETWHQGIYNIAANNESVAFNLISRRGTLQLPGSIDPGRDSSATVTNASWSAVIFEYVSWQALLVSAVTLGFLEWFLFNRRVIRIV